MIPFGPLLHALSAWFDGDSAPGEAGVPVRNVLLTFAQQADARDLLPTVVFNADWYAARHGLAPAKAAAPGLPILQAYLKTGVPAGHDPTAWFSEAWYRDAYPDVAAGIAAGTWTCAYHHYLGRGLREGRSPSADFNELAYLGRHGDVLDGVREGRVPCGFLHYAAMGRHEGRSVGLPLPAPLLPLPLVPPPMDIAPSSAFAEDLYLAVNSDVPRDGQALPGMRHWLAHGLQDDRRGTRARHPDYVENVYLRQNPDISFFVGSGNQPSGYHHFLMYGMAEGRSWAGTSSTRNGQRHLARAMDTHTAPTPADRDLPVISIIVPVFNSPAPLLRACIESVRRQTHPGWELCLADDGSFLPETLETLSAAQSDPRVKVAYAGRNGGISAASNMALALAAGPFVALLDHDDVLAPDALLHVARAFASAPDVDMVYTDEGKLAEDGTLQSLNLKPGWSPSQLLSTMYIGHLTAYRRSLVDEVGGFRSMFDGTQDYDLALRMAEVVRQVVHVPLPLYLWRLSPSSTAGSIDAKPGVLELQRQALENALIRRGERGTVQPGHSLGHWTVALDPPEDTPLVSVVIPTAGRTATIGGSTIDLVVTCIRSLQRAETYPNVEYLVVHNDDLRPETLAGLSLLRRVRLVAYRAARFNLSDKINLGVEAAAGRYVLLLNDDMQAASQGIVQSMLGRMFQGVGIVGGRLLYANGTLQHAGIVWSAEGPTHAMIGEHRLTAGPAERLRIMHDCFGVSGACMFFRRDVFLDAGGFSPRLATNYNDVDLCLKIRARGLRIVFNPDVTMFHFESLSKSGTHFWELQLLALSYPGISDPFWNPGFSQRSPFYELRDPDAVEQPSYRAWLLDRMMRRRASLTTAETTRFSLFMSVYETRRDQLEELEATIVNQTYSNWEWVVVDNGSTRPETLAWLEGIKGHPKVRFIRLEENMGIMGGYGTAFRASTGDYVVPVDSDDFLTLDCLHVLATAIERGDGPDALYSDEDKATETGNTHSPFLKPDWDPVLFSNICYVCHVCAIRRTVALAVGAYSDEGAAWCHDWDTFLRLQRADARIVHVPELLYSWRIHQGSTASIETGMKPQTLTSQRHVLEQHLRLTGQDQAFRVVQNELFPHDGIWRLKPVPGRAGRSAVLLVASPEMPRLTALLLDIARGIGKDTLLLVVGGTDMTHRAIARLPPELTRMLGRKGASRLKHELGLSEALALCAEEGCETVAVLDTGLARLEAGWLDEGVGMFSAAPDVDAVGGQVLLADGRVAWRGGYRGFGGMAAAPDYGRAAADSGYHGMGWCQRSCDAVPSVCFFARRSVLAEVAAELAPGPLVLRDLAGRVAAAAWRAGRRVIYTPFVQVTMGRETPVAPLLANGDATHAAETPAWYPAAFGRELRTAYALTTPAPIQG